MPLPQYRRPAARASNTPTVSKPSGGCSSCAARAAASRAQAQNTSKNAPQSVNRWQARK